MPLIDLAFWNLIYLMLSVRMDVKNGKWCTGTHCSSWVLFIFNFLKFIIMWSSPRWWLSPFRWLANGKSERQGPENSSSQPVFPLIRNWPGKSSQVTGPLANPRLLKWVVLSFSLPPFLSLFLPSFPFFFSVNMYNMKKPKIVKPWMTDQGRFFLSGCYMN